MHLHLRVSSHYSLTPPPACHKKDNPIPIRDVLYECSLNAIIAKKFMLKGPILKQSSWSNPASTEAHPNLSEFMCLQPVSKPVELILGFFQKSFYSKKGAKM